MTLYALQVMKYWLRTAYGDAEQPFGGTREDPCMGLGQGSGASNPACTTTLTLLINAYKRRNFHAELTAAWSGIVFALAAIMYVDDTDLLFAY